MKSATLLCVLFLSCCASVLRADDTELNKWFIAQWRSQGFVVGKPAADFFDYIATQCYSTETARTLDDVWGPDRSPKPDKVYAYDLAFFYDIKRGVPDFGLVRYRTADGSIVVQTFNSYGRIETKKVTLDWLFELYRPRRPTPKLSKDTI